MPMRSLLAAVLYAINMFPAFAHEFWIDPHDFTVATGESIVADLRVGQLFEGTPLSYLPNSFKRFDMAQGSALVPVEGRMGDRPALGMAAPGEGLAVFIHVTTDSVLTWDEFPDFEAFARHKDASWAIQSHSERGLPQEKFREAYSRHVKSMVSVGSGKGADREFGLITEIVALANPYVDDMDKGLPVRLLYKGAPRADTQIEVFEKSSDGGVEVLMVRTDAAGEASVPVRPGFIYMLDAVVLREPEGELTERPDIVWESLWANLTFAVPE